MTNQQKNNIILNNLFWFAASLILALFVWVVASNEADPIQERQLIQSVPIQLEIDDGLIAVDQTSRTVRVTVRAARSVNTLLTSDDIVIRADLKGRGPGQYTVELKSTTTRRVVDLDTQPRQITVTLEPLLTQQIAVVPMVTEPPPTGFEWDITAMDETQVLVSGAATRVQRVAAIQAPVDLADRRTNFETDVRVVPVDVDGNIVTDVEVEPQIIQMDIQIALLEGVREVPVVPNIRSTTIPDGYNLVTYTSEPLTVVVSGDLSRIPDVLETEPISLADRTEDFEATVPIVLPDGRLFILSEQQNVQVSISISPIITTRAFDGVPVEVIGLAGDLEAEVVNDQVALVLRGPQVEMDAIEAGNLQVVLDLAGLEPGQYDLTPIAFNGQIQINAERISSISPPTLSVTIREIAEVTPPPDP